MCISLGEYSKKFYICLFGHDHVKWASEQTQCLYALDWWVYRMRRFSRNVVSVRRLSVVFLISGQTVEMGNNHRIGRIETPVRER